MSKINNKGFAHFILLLLVICLVAITGTLLLVGSHAYPSKGPVTSRNPYTNLCPGNQVRYGAPRGKTSTVSARTSVFGQPYPYAKNVQTSFMGKPVTVNKKIEPCLKAVEWDLINKYHSEYKVKTIYGASEVNAQNPPYYFHAYGAAVDINPAENPQCKNSCKHDMPQEYVRAFKKHGFFWGGNFRVDKDYMHFEWHGQKPR